MVTKTKEKEIGIKVRYVLLTKDSYERTLVENVQAQIKLHRENLEAGYSE